MTKNLPTTTPAEVVDISPESLEVANCYLQNPSVEEVSNQLAIPPEIVSDILARREVKAYINQVFFDTGFNNRFRMRQAMDALIARKFQELDEAGVGSSKDIAELLALSHKMTLELMEKEIALEKIKQSNVRSQVNVQINENGLGGGTNYGNLIERLIKSDI